MRPFVQLEPEFARTTFPGMYWVERDCKAETSMLREAGQYVSRRVERDLVREVYFHNAEVEPWARQAEASTPSSSHSRLSSTRLHY